MNPEVEVAVAALTDMTVGELRTEYRRVFGQPTASRHRIWLMRRIAWRIQAKAEGGLSERALTRARELADEADVRLTPPRGTPAPLDPAQTVSLPAPRTEDGELVPGTLLRRDWKGRRVTVRVLEAGFEYEGERYGSLSAAARAITGTRWNGHVFFGLKKRSGAA